MPTVHASPRYRIIPAEPAPPGYPATSAPDSFTAWPGESDFEARRQAFQEHWRRNPAPTNLKSIYVELVRLAAGDVPHHGILQAALDFVDARKDCADFVLHGVLRLLYQFDRDPHCDPALLARARQTVLTFKYWPDEPGVDSMCTWTENHQILFASAAYLAGQRYPDAVFTNSGRRGQELMARHRPRIERWLDLRFRTGFSEWLSHVYYDEDLTALLSLVDFCADRALADRAAMVVDLLLLDVALNSFRGVFGSSHGRSYGNTKKWAQDEGTTDTGKLLFGMGQYSGFDNMSAACLALSTSYQVPAAIIAIAQDLRRPEMMNRQQMGLRVDDAARWGLGFDGVEDGMTWLSLEAYLHPRTAGLTLRLFDAFDWWQNDFFTPFRPFRRLLTGLRRSGALPLLAQTMAWDLCRNTREAVNVTTFRTPDYMLSCAQDYRPGYGGDQQHIWQATLGPDAVCFTTHPAQYDATPNRWAGSGQLPRAAQVQNVAIVIYNLHRKPALYVPTRLWYTHAWLPRDRFDEILERDGWIFVRKGEGYLALYSQRPYRWRQGREGDPAVEDEDVGREVVADGRQNIWICELGRRAVDGTFGDFVERIVRAAVHCRGLNVAYESPSQGRLTFGWQGPLRQNGRIIPLDDFPRYDNPYVQAAFPVDVVEVRCAGHRLCLNWPEATRTEERAPAGPPG